MHARELVKDPVNSKNNWKREDCKAYKAKLDSEILVF
jgi:hypothetical protein